MKQKQNTAFEEWWNRVGRFYDPDTSDVPWEDKRKFLAELAFETATSQSRIYTANVEINPTEITFSNGRIVACESGILVVKG